MVDQLVMLLSTDWFRPYWETLGIQVDHISKSLTQLGCRKILEQILDGAENYYHISFARERIEETRSMLLSLTGKPGTGETLRKVVERWDNLSEEDEKAAWMWNALTSDVLAGRVRAVETGLDPSIVEIIFGGHENYDMEPYEFAVICQESLSSWDQYTHSLTPGQPTALADTLASVLTTWRFEAFWYSIQHRLTSKQRDALIGWYRRMGKARAGRDLLPSYAN